MMKSKQFLAMMLAAMLAVGSAAVPAFAAENTSETEEADQVSKAVFEKGIMDGNLSAEEESSDKMSEEQEEAQPAESEENEKIADPAEESAAEDAAETVEAEESEEETVSEQAEAVPAEAVPEEQEKSRVGTDVDAQDAAGGKEDPEELVEAEAPAEPETLSTKAMLTESKDNIASGFLGNNISWTLNGQGTLIISGSGSMTDPKGWGGHGNSINNVEIESGLLNIYMEAFSDCSNLTSVTIPDSVTRIGSAVFSGCSNLTSVTIPDSVTRLGNNTFANCSSLRSITIPSGIRSVPEGAFSGCSSLTSVTLPENLTNIGKKAFSGCGSLESIAIPASVTGMGNEAFANCSSLRSITIPASLKAVSEGTFFGCSSLESVTLPNSVTSIGTNAFSGCTNLKNVYYSGSEIKWKSFEQLIGRGNDNLLHASIHCGTDYSDAGKAAYGTCGDTVFWTLYEDGTLVVAGMGNMKEDYENWGGHKNSISRVIIESDVTSIYPGAFSDCSSLTSVTLPDSVIRVGKDAFLGCSSLREITIPKNMKYIYEGTFSGCSSLTSVTLPNSMTSIGIRAFADCGSLANITIPASVTNISEEAFSGCTNLRDVYYTGSEDQWKSISVGKQNDPLLHASIHYVADDPDSGSSAAGTCGDNLSWTLYEGTLTIEGIGDMDETEASPWDGYGLEVAEVVIQSGVTSIGAEAFSGCSSLASITIPASVTRIGKYAFSDCFNLKDVYYSGSEEEWRAVSIGNGNDLLLDASIHCVTTPLNIEDALISGLSDKTYTGSAITQTPVVTHSGKVLTEGTDYTVAYSNNKNAGTATVTITGMGDYTGKTEKTFTIEKADQNFTVKAAATSINVGKTTKVTAAGARETRKYTFTSSNPKVAAVDAKGKVTGKSAGKVTITVRIPETANYKAGAGMVEITVKKVPKKPGHHHFIKWNTLLRYILRNLFY